VGRERFLPILRSTLGLLLGGSFGIGTILYAATMGAALQLISQAFADHGAGRSRRLADGGVEPAATDGPSGDRLPVG